jgi:hypothetical protein
MNRRDPLEHAFELMKADSTELAANPNLENRLMTELQKQNRPRSLRKVAMILAALLALILAGGGIAVAAGFNPIKFFITIDSDGTAYVLDENGQPTTAQIQVIPNQDGSVEARMEMPAAKPGQVIELQVHAPDAGRK